MSSAVRALVSILLIAPAPAVGQLATGSDAEPSPIEMVSIRVRGAPADAQVVLDPDGWLLHRRAGGR